MQRQTGIAAYTCQIDRPSQSSKWILEQGFDRLMLLLNGLNSKIGDLIWEVSTAEKQPAGEIQRGDIFCKPRQAPRWNNPTPRSPRYELVEDLLVDGQHPHAIMRKDALPTPRHDRLIQNHIEARIHRRRIRMVLVAWTIAQDLSPPTLDVGKGGAVSAEHVVGHDPRGMAHLGRRRRDAQGQPSRDQLP